VIHVFLLDDHEMVRRGVAALIDSHDDMVVVGEADSAEAALASVGATNPHVAVLDISLRDGELNGIDVCRTISERHPDVACLMLTSVVDDRALIEAQEAGAAAFALKSVGADDLAQSIRKVASGARLFDVVDAKLARRRMDESGVGRVESLTPQERRIFDLIGTGRSNREIADQMFLAEKTVKNYVSNLLAKLSLARRAEAAALAARMAERESGWRS